MAFKTSSKQKLSTNNVGFSTTIGTGSSGPTITTVYITDNSYVNLDDTAISTSGGYIKLIGTGFVSGCTVYVNGVAVTTTFVSSTEVRAVVPAAVSGTYSLMLFNSASSGAIFASGLMFSGFPIVSTSSYTNNSNVISVQLLATGDSTLTYSLQSGSTLPTGVSLSTSGLISGTATAITSATVVSFTVLVNDAQLQTTQQAITLSLTFGDDYFKYNTLAIQGDTTTFISDISTNALLVTPISTVKASQANPYQGDGYYSTQFNGTSNYLNTAAFDATFTGDFTFECWAYLTAYGGTSCFFTIGNESAGRYYFALTASGGQLWSNVYGGGNFTWGTSTSVPLNTWTHVAWVRSGTTVTGYVNGVSVGTATISGTVGNANGVWIGANPSAGYLWPGYLSNVRLVNGTAVYTGTFTPPTAPLAATQSAGTNIAAITTGTKLLTCQSNRHKDNSTLATAITATNNPNIQQNIPFTLVNNTYGSGYFNGTSDYLSTPANAVLGFGTGDFTVEYWFYQTSIATAEYEILESQTTGAFGIYKAGASGALSFKAYAGTDQVILAHASVPVNTWTHIAVSRSSSTTKAFVNGTQVLSVADSTNYVTPTAVYTIGGRNAGSNYFPGYISNLRVIKGTAVYTSAAGFTPPTAPLTALTNTSLLTLQTRLSYNNNTYIDDSGYNTIITQTGTPAQGSFSPFSPTGWSTNFNGTTNYLSIPANAVLGFGTGDFTVEYWFNQTSIATAEYEILESQTTGAFAIYKAGSSGALSFKAYAGTDQVILAHASVPVNTWTHIAVSRVSGTTKAFVNGTQVLSIADSTNYVTPTAVYTIGGRNAGSNYFPGYISNLRIVKGVGVYTATFTVSTNALTVTQSANANGSPSTAITGTATSLLTCQSTRFIDTSTNALAITSVGSPSIQAFSPFKPLVPYDIVSHGGSTWFNGSSDYLAVSTSTSLVLTGDFTFEAWVYCNSFSTNKSIFTIGSEASGRAVFLLTTTGQLKFDIFGSTNATTTATVALNTWNHVAVARSGTTVYTFINGVLTGTTTAVSATFGNTTQYTVGSNGARTGEYMSGHISNLRLIKGVALYSNVTLPPITALAARTPSTVLLLNSTSASVIDASTKSNIGTVGDARISGSTKKYGVGSVYFDGTGDYLSIPTTSLSGDFGTGDFTVEFWMNASAAGTSVAVVGTQSIAGNTTAGIWRVSNRLASVNGLYFTYTTGSAYTDLTFSTTNYNDGTWHHIAVTRASGTVKMFVDGTSVGTPTTVSQSLTSGQKIYVGYDVQNAQYYTGYVDDLRITKGYARYTANFTAPTATFLVN